MSSHTYSAEFYQWTRNMSARSAARVLPLLRDLKPASVLDVGSGVGSWLAAWRELGVQDVVGLDGAYVDTQWLMIPPACFRPTDISAPFDLQRRFDLVQSLEVAEHIAPTQADAFVARLAAHGDLVLFAAAQPGQGGEHHVNEQTVDYWAAKFDRLGYAGYDAVRPRIQDDALVAPWYRYNTVLFVKRERVDLVARVQALPSARPLSTPATRYEPAVTRLRYAVLAPLPVAVISWISRVNSALFSLMLRLRLKRLD